MKALFGSIIVKGSGKLGGSAVSGSRSGSVLKTKKSPINRNSNAQSQVRSNLAAVSSTWHNLSDSQRIGWEAFAKVVPQTNDFGNTIFLSGFGIFCKCNQSRIALGFSILLTAPGTWSSFALTSFSFSASTADNSLNLVFTPPIPAAHKLKVFASRPGSQGISASYHEFCYIGSLSATDTSPYNIGALYIAKFGAVGSTGQKIFIKVVPVEIASGLESQPFIASTIVESIPFPSDALLWLHGDIVNISGSYYFNDGISSRKFLITNYDFPSTWSIGFPYKSKATVSAPVGDAILIAKDVNNFLYDSGGTPRQVPVVSFFQNVDYKNKLFCYLDPQTVDYLTQVETWEPRVKDIILYNNAKTGSALTLCNSFFAVPAIDVAAKWLDVVNGSDSNDGSQAHPYKTWAVANTNATTVVYAMTGDDDFGGSYKQLNKNLTCIGYHRVYNAGTSYNILFHTASKTVKGLIVDGGGSGGGIYADVNGALIDRCLLKGHGNNYGCMFGGNITISNSVFAESLTSIAGYFVQANANSTTITLNSNYFSGLGQMVGTSTKTGVNAVLSYNKLNGCSIGFYANAVVSGNITSLNNTGVALQYIYSKDYGNITSSYDALSLSNSYISSAPASETVGTVSLVGNSVVSSTANGIVIVIGKSFVATANIIQQNGAGGVLQAYALSQVPTYQVAGNIIISTSVDSGCVVFGTSALVNESKGIGYFKYNLVLGNELYNPVVNIGHGVCAFYNKNIEFAYNYIDGWQLPFVLKGPDIDYATVSVHHNVCINGRITVKGVNNSLIYNNTCYNATRPNGCFVSIVYEGGVIHSKNTVLRNNIWINLDPTVSPYGWTTGETFTSNNNRFYSASGLIDGTSNFTAWQGLGYDSASTYGLITFFNPANKQLWPVPYLTGGQVLGSPFDYGLYISSSFGNASTLPSVVLKQQSASWQLGAYVQ